MNEMNEKARQILLGLCSKKTLSAEEIAKQLDMSIDIQNPAEKEFLERVVNSDDQGRLSLNAQYLKEVVQRQAQTLSELKSEISQLQESKTKKIATFLGFRSGKTYLYANWVDVRASDDPPRQAEFLLYLTPKRFRDFSIGDLEEEFKTILVPKYGIRLARFLYWWNVLIEVFIAISSGLKGIAFGFMVSKILPWLENFLKRSRG